MDEESIKEMVRLKHRYLLVNILYTDPKASTWANKDGDAVPYSIQLRQASSALMSGKILSRLIRDGVSDLFGDYGSGKIAGSLQSTFDG